MNLETFNKLKLHVLGIMQHDPHGYIESVERLKQATFPGSSGPDGFAITDAKLTADSACVILSPLVRVWAYGLMNQARVPLIKELLEYPEILHRVLVENSYVVGKRYTSEIKNGKKIPFHGVVYENVLYHARLDKSGAATFATNQFVTGLGAENIVARGKGASERTNAQMYDVVKKLDAKLKPQVIRLRLGFGRTRADANVDNGGHHSTTAVWVDERGDYVSIDTADTRWIGCTITDVLSWATVWAVEINWMEENV